MTARSRISWRSARICIGRVAGTSARPVFPIGYFRDQPWRCSRGLGDKPFCAGIHLSLADIAVGCALGYLDFRFASIDWHSDYPNLHKLQDKLMQRQSFSDTAPV